MIKKIIVSMVICFSLITTQAYAQNSSLDGKTIYEANQVYGDNIIFNASVIPMTTDIYIGNPYTAASRDGFTQYTDSQGKKYLYRIRHIKLDQIDYGDITNSSHIISIPIGAAYSTTKTTSISKSYSKTWSSSASASASFNVLKIPLTVKVEQQYTTQRSETETFTISEGTTYTFPSNAPDDTNIAHFYAGFINDKYEVVADMVKYTSMEKLTRIIDMYPDPNLPNKLVVLELEDGRTKILNKVVVDRYVRGDYYVETVYGYDYNNMETVTGTLLSPKPITYTLFGSL